MKQVEATVTYASGFWGHCGNITYERKRVKKISDEAAKILDAMLKKCKSTSNKEPTIVSCRDIGIAITKGVTCLSKLHCDLMKSDSAEYYIINNVKEVDDQGVEFSTDMKELIGLQQPISGEYIIPSKVRKIRDNAFRYNAKDIERVVIHSKVNSIGESVWAECPNLQSIEVAADNPYYCSEDGVLYNKEKTCILRYPPKKDGISYIVPNSVTEIAPCSFYACELLTNISLQNNINRIGHSALSHCGVTSIDIPTSLTEIEPYTFSGSKLKSIVIPGNIKTIREAAFIYSRKLSKVELNEGLERIEKDAFDDCPIKRIKIPKSAKKVFKLAFGRESDVELI